MNQVIDAEEEINGWKRVSRNEDFYSWRKGDLSVCILTVDGVMWQVELGFLVKDHEASQPVWAGSSFAEAIEKANDVMNAV